eukprot:scaffold11612_cov124-Isochrysis_galbana.AAC.2
MLSRASERPRCSGPSTAEVSPKSTAPAPPKCASRSGPTGLEPLLPPAPPGTGGAAAPARPASSAGCASAVACCSSFVSCGEQNRKHRRTTKYRIYSAFLFLFIRRLFPRFPFLLAANLPMPSFPDHPSAD